MSRHLEVLRQGDNERGRRGAGEDKGRASRVTLRLCARVAARCLSRGGAGGARALRPTSCSDEIGWGREGPVRKWGVFKREKEGEERERRWGRGIGRWRC